MWLDVSNAHAKRSETRAMFDSVFLARPCGDARSVADPAVPSISYVWLTRHRSINRRVARHPPRLTFVLARAQAEQENPRMWTLLEEAKSPRGSWKAEICRREDGNFQVFLMRWIDEVAPDHGNVASFWSEVKTAVSITDSLERARSIARELLRTHARDEYTDGTEGAH